MTKTRVKNLMEAFPTKEEKQLMSGEINEIPERSTYTYWTNFDRADPTEYLIARATGIKGYWWKFTTNLTLQDLAKMDKGRQIRFMKSMWEIYRYRKANV